jgi:hypothetical protein
MIAAMMMSIEWQLLSVFVTGLGLAIPQLLWVAMAMFATPVVLAIVAAFQAPLPRHTHPLTRWLTAYLHWRQPITRGWARYSVRLRAKVLNIGQPQDRPKRPLPFDPADPQVLRYWSKSHERLHLVEAIAKNAARDGWRLRTDEGWQPWDVEIYASRYVKVRISSATEIHGGGAMLTRVRVKPLMSKFCQTLTVSLCMLSGLLLYHLWPFSRPAALIPVVMAAMYLANKVRVTRPVLSLIDSTASDLGFVAVPRKQASSQMMSDAPPDEEDKAAVTDAAVSTHAAVEQTAER